jgi:hypothetical protein
MEERILLLQKMHNNKSSSSKKQAIEKERRIEHFLLLTPRSHTYIVFYKYIDIL